MSMPQTLPFPMIRITLDAMKASLVQAFCDQEAGWKEGLAEQVDLAVKNFDVEGEVRREMGGLLREEVRRAVAGALSESFRDERIRAVIRGIVEEGVRKAFPGEAP